MRSLERLHSEVEKRLVPRGERGPHVRLRALRDLLSRAEKRALAADPNTRPEMLAVMVRDPRLRKPVLRNPNLPFEYLVKYAEQYPHEVLANKALALQILEKPSAMDEFDRFTLEALLATGQPPSWVWQAWAFFSPWCFSSFRDVVVRLPRLPEWFIERALEDLRKRLSALEAISLEQRRYVISWEANVRLLRGYQTWTLGRGRARPVVAFRP